MNKFITTLLVLPALLYTHSVVAEGICPASIATKQSAVATPKDWQVTLTDVPSDLMGVTLYDGTPKEKASLVPDNDADSLRAGFYLWTLSANNPRKYWLECVYANTNITLAKELPAGITECRVSIDPKVRVAGMPHIMDVSCK